MPDPVESVEIGSDHIAAVAKRAGCAWLTDGGDSVGVLFSAERYAQLVADVERLELELRAWQSEAQMRDGTLIEHDEVVASSERLVGEG